MTFKPVAGNPVSLAKHVGVAFQIPEGDGTGQHVGLLYRLSDGTQRLAHLMFHERLKGEPAPEGDGYVWADCGWLNRTEHERTGPFVARFIQGTLRNRKVPYGLDPDLDCFATGQHVETDPRYGLTCATYVAAALKGAGIDILDIATWVPRPGDDAWSEWVLGILAEHVPERAEQLAGQKAPFRVRPDEMAAAASGDSYPVTMSEAADAARNVRKAVEGLR